MTQLVPAQPFPALELAKVGGGTVTLGKPATGRLQMVDVYRGLHCPRCKGHLSSIVENLAAFEAAGIDVVAASTDPAGRAEEAAREWRLSPITVAYGMTIPQARGLGLLISQSIREGETDQFAEPGVFYIRDDGTLYGSIVQTFPFARPGALDLAEVGKMIMERNYPPRGGA